MDYTSEPKYAEWLNVIAKTRLVFNTMDELEDFLDNHNISSNGVKRAFPTSQKIRSAFNDLYMYADKVTDGIVDLGYFMSDYEEASTFFGNRLARRNNSEKISADLISFLYLDSNEHYTKSMRCIYEDIEKNAIDESIIILMLMGALPGYNSKYGDVGDFLEKYEAVVNFFERFTKDAFGEVLPCVTDARFEEVKSRITLYDHVTNIIRLIEINCSNSKKFDESENLRSKRLNFKLDGYWNECGGRNDRTDFWKVIATDKNGGNYFAIKYTKMSDGTINMLKYNVFVGAGDDGRVVVFVLHPKSPEKYVIKGVELDESDRIWYAMDMPDNWSNINDVALTRTTRHKCWRESLTLTRVTDHKITKAYDSLLANCTIVNPYAKFDYTFILGFHAMTKDAIYIPAEEQGKYYKVPLKIDPTLQRINSTSNVGKMYMGGEIYIALDIILLYIPTKKFKDYGIGVVERVE